VTYQIVGDDEADLKLGLINIQPDRARADRQGSRRYGRGTGALAACGHAAAAGLSAGAIPASARPPKRQA
jgi:hypothetical protein